MVPEVLSEVSSEKHSRKTHMDSKQHHLRRILMLPWLAHGHISPFLELAKCLVQKNFQVFICSSSVNLSPLRKLSSKLSSLIEFVEIHLPSTSELPPDRHCTKNLPPHLMSALKTAFDDAKDGFCHILRELEPDLVIYDFTQPWAPVVAREESVPAVLFITFSAAACAFLYHQEDQDSDILGLKFSTKERKKMVQFTYDVSNGLTDKERYFQCIKNSSSCILIKTLNETEYKHVDHLSKLVGKEVIPVGPLVQEPEANSGDSELLKWLDQKQPSSAVFVSFGSEYFLSKEEIKEIARGLELSMVNFILVLRFHETKHVVSLHNMLPNGFLDRVRGRGMVVEGWVPQAEILRHPSIGGFVSHCGRSSLMESVSVGVPIIAMPMHLDQPINATLVTEIGAGIEVPRAENGELSREDIARVIREVVVEERGEEIRKKVKEMSTSVKQKGDQEIDHTVRKLLQLVGNS